MTGLVRNMTLKQVAGWLPSLVVVNNPPIFTSAEVLAPVNGSYDYEPIATDADGDAVTITATTLPVWLTFNGSRLTGSSVEVIAGNYDVVLRASDGALSVEQAFTIVISAAASSDAAPYGRCVAIGDSGKTFEIDPSDLSDYWLLWGDKLGTDQINSLTVDATDGLTVSGAEVLIGSVVDDQGNAHLSSSVVSLWLSGGVAGVAYQVTVTIETVGGRRWQRSFNVLCIEL